MNAAALGLLHKGTIFVETEDEMPLLMEYCIYFPRGDGSNLVTKYLKNSPPPAESEEMRALQAMTQAYYSIFRVMEVRPGLGVVVLDVLRNESSLIVDIGLGTTGHVDAAFATRVLPMDGYLVTTGAALPLNKSCAGRILQDMQAAGLDYQTREYRPLTRVEEAKLAAIAIRASRATGMTSRIRYAEPGEPARSSGQRPVRRNVGRNDYCPCGSGKKYKVCCGRK